MSHSSSPSRDRRDRDRDSKERRRSPVRDRASSTSRRDRDREDSRDKRASSDKRVTSTRDNRDKDDRRDRDRASSTRREPRQSRDKEDERRSNGSRNDADHDGDHDADEANNNNNINKRRREEDERDTSRDNKPRYLQATNANIPKALMDKENDKDKVARRQKQIDFGKNTIGYQRYMEAIPKDKRKRTDVWTPDVNHRCSKRSFDGQVRKWRRLLHEYDPLTAEGEVEIDLDNEDEDLSHLQKELDEGRDSDEAKENKSDNEVKPPAKIESKTEAKPSVVVKADPKSSAVAANVEAKSSAAKTDPKPQVVAKTELTSSGDTFNSKLPFSKPLSTKWADMCEDDD